MSTPSQTQTALAAFQKEAGKTAHTPGPWKTIPREVLDVNGYPSGCIVHELWAIENGEEIRIGEIWCHKYFSHHTVSEGMAYAATRNAANAAHIVLAVNAHQSLVEAVRLAGKNAESRLYLLPLQAHESERKQLETEVATYAAALRNAGKG